MTNELTPENALSAQHAEWLRHPVTQTLLHNLVTYREKFVGDMIANVSNYAIDNYFFRVQSMGCKTIDGVTKVITDTTTFVQLTNKAQ